MISYAELCPRLGLTTNGKNRSQAHITAKGLKREEVMNLVYMCLFNTIFTCWKHQLWALGILSLSIYQALYFFLCEEKSNRFLLYNKFYLLSRIHGVEQA